MSVLSRRRLAVAALLTLLAFGGAAASASAEDAVVTANRAQFHAALLAYGVDRSTLSGCGADPWAPGCPPVTTVVATLTEFACASEVDPGPITAEATTTQDSSAAANPCQTSVMAPYAAGYPDLYAGGTERDHGSGSACGVRAEWPARTYYQSTFNYYIRSRGINHCFSGQGVSRMEAWVTLWRERLDNQEGWTRLDTKEATPINGAGQQYTPYATWDCNHTRSLYYRAEAAAYSVVRGTGYFGVNRKTDALTCAD